MRTAGCLLAAILVAGTACGDQILGIPRGMPVSDLEETDAIELCDEFVATFCRDTPPAPFDGVCDGCVRDELCAMPALVSEMDDECGGVTVGQVRDCAEGRTEGLCAPATGGCMIDVAAGLCAQ